MFHLNLAFTTSQLVGSLATTKSIHHFRHQLHSTSPKLPSQPPSRSFDSCHHRTHNHHQHKLACSS
eukprot:c45907_g1_i1 orf=1-195(-)